VKILVIGSAALRSLRRSPVRSALTALGVIMGVSAVVATLNIGAGARASIEKSLLRPEARLISLMAIAPPTEGPSAEVLAKQDRLRPDDYEVVQHSVQNLTAATPQIYLANVRVRINGRYIESGVEGLDVGGFEIASRRLISGTLFTAGDVQQTANVCVVSETFAKETRLGRAIVGRSVRIDGIPFIVLGVVDDLVFEDVSRPNFKDLHLYMPFTSVLRRLSREAEMSIIVQARDIRDVASVRQQLADTMEVNRGGRKGIFYIANPTEAIRAYSAGAETMARLLAAIGAISLIVGGVGIMNIMLVSVAERTREIGIRLAVGTRSADILVQFLIEAAALSVLGGAVGVVLGVVACWLMAYLNAWSIDVTFTSISLALICSLLVGILFGLHPARRAALLDPVDALRSD
jgi:putative ABC transport system permease protein